jgi:LysR family glycine cleavage system transcriptional activator
MPRKLPPLNALRTFEVAARLSSFSQAATELCVTHGAVSQQIRALEDYFGQPLFDRVHGKVVLNAAGTDLLPAIVSSLDGIESASARVAVDTGPEILTVNVTTIFASHWLISRLRDFQQRYPEIEVHLAPSPTFPDNLGRGVDVAIRWGATNMANTRVEKLIDVDTFVACAPSLINGPNPLRQPQDLLAHNLIHDDNGQAWQILLQELGVEGRKPGKELFYADSGLALQEAVEGGGLIVAGSLLAARDLEAGRLIIPFDCFIPHRKDYQLYYPEHAASQLKVQLFCSWIHQQASIYKDNAVDYRRFIP